MRRITEDHDGGRCLEAVVLEERETSKESPPRGYVKGSLTDHGRLERTLAILARLDGAQ